jgi:hypothetical protein
MRGVRYGFVLFVGFGSAACGESSPNSESSGATGAGAAGGSINGSAGSLGTSGGTSGTSTGGSGANGAGAATSTGGGVGASGGQSGSGGSSGAPSGCGGAANTPEPGDVTLVPGVWTELPVPNDGESVSCIAIDPSNPLTIWAGINWKGIFKTTDGGATWDHVGGDSDENPWDKQTTYFDDASSLAVDPADPDHLYLTKGVDGNNLGFWETSDGGQNWTMPEAFPPENTTTDVTAMVVDPCDFNHILVGSHGWWGEGTAGIMESTDGGTTWVVRARDKFPAGSLGMSFLYGPSLDLENSQTWLVFSEGTWRTTDSGENWTKVFDQGGVHGSAETYYTSDGTLYAGGWTQPKYSTDNGLSWTTIGEVPGSAYYTIGGDGESVFVEPEGGSYYSSTNGADWEEYSDTHPDRSALQLRFDEVNKILYSVNWDAGVWALKME